MTSTKNSFIRDTDYSTLPTHIITQILKYLTLKDFKSAAQVCKSWYYGSTDPYFVRKLCARITAQNIETIFDCNQRGYSKLIIACDAAANDGRAIMNNILQHHIQCVREIEFFHCNKTNLETIVNLFAKNLCNLDSLTIKSRKNLFAESSGGDLTSVSQLKHFSLYTLCDFNSVDSVKNLDVFLNDLNSLTSLELHSKFDVIFEDFMEIFKTWPILMNLTALGLHVIKHKNFLILLKNLLNVNFKNLRTLKLYDAYHDEIMFASDSVEYCDLMDKFGAKFINLHELYVGYATDEILKNIFKYMKNLKILGVSCCHQVEFKEIDIFYIVEKLQINVYTYYNSFVGNDRPLESNVLKLFDNKFTNLKGLKINGAINPETLGCILQNCPNLQELIVSGLQHFYNKPHEIYDRLTRLEILKINNREINRKHTT